MPIALGRTSRLAQWGTAFIVLSCGVASLSWPFGWDQANFAQVGDVINRGGMPYRDGWDTKGPLTYYLLALSQQLFGTNQWGIRIIDFALLLAGAWALARTVGSLTSANTGRWAGLVFMLIYLSGGYWDTAQPDAWVALLLTLAMTPLIVSAEGHGFRHLILAGALVGLCALMKWLYVAFLLLPLTAVFVMQRSRVRILATRTAAVLAGFLIPTVACVSWFFARGALDDFVEVHIRYAYEINQFGATSLKLLDRAYGTAKFLTGANVIVALPVIVLGAIVLWRRVRSACVLFGLWIAIALGLVALQNRYVYYHWIPIFPALAVLCAVGIHAVLGTSASERALERAEHPQWTARLLGVLTAAVLVLYAAAHPVISVARWSAFASGLISEEEYYDRFTYSAAGLKAARYLRERTTARDEVALWGTNSSILYLSRRASPTRFIFYHPLVRGRGTQVRNVYREEYLHSLQRSRPAYFVVSTEDLSVNPVPQDLRDFPELLRFVLRDYTLEKAFGGVTLYRRRDDGGAR